MAANTRAGETVTCGSRIKYLRTLFKSSSLLAVLFLVLFPFQSSFATSGIAAQVAAACAPSPTVPDVGSCSSCHSTTNNRGPNDLTTAGMWSLSSATFMNFCPNATPTPPPPAPAPPASPPPGAPGSTPPPTGMGSGTGGDMDDDDDDEEEEMDEDDDDVAPASAAGSSGTRSFFSRILGR